MTFGEAFAAARAAGLPDFEYNGERYTTELAEVAPTKKELDYPGTDVPYKYRGLGDVEFRADIDPIISGIPPALLKYQDIEQKTGGDVGELIKVILGEDDPNNPPGMFTDAGSTFGRYIPTKDERYYKKDNLGEPGVAYAFEPDTSKFDSNRLIETIAEELAHGGMRILENEGYDPIVGVSEQSELPLEEELMDQYQYRTREDTPEISIGTIGGRTNVLPTVENAEVFANMLNRIDEQSLKELRKRGRVSTPFTRKEPEEESFFEKLIRTLGLGVFGGEEPKPLLTRYAQGGIASIRKV
jgi:hypothetical protein